jgi:signal peptidase I
MFVGMALIFSAVWLAFSPAGNIIIAGGLLLVCGSLHIWSLFDAHKCARKGNTDDFEKSRRNSKDPWLAFFLSGLPGLGHVYLKKWFWGIIFFISFVIFSKLGRTNLLFMASGAALSAFVCYHAYIGSPARRESSKKLVIFLSLVVLASELGGGHIPVIYATRYVKENYIEAFKLSSGSMEPILHKGDHVLVRKSKNYVPKRGDLIVFKYPKDQRCSFLKRIVAFGGETVEIKEGSIYVNGSRLNNPPFSNNKYTSEGKFSVLGNSFLVPRNSFFFLGDKSERSQDSRFFGPVPETDVIGKVYKIYWPIDRMGPVE